jgi:hypothetical protein
MLRGPYEIPCDSAANNQMGESLVAAVGNCLTSGDAGPDNRFVLNTDSTSGTVNASCAMPIDNLVAGSRPATLGQDNLKSTS